MAPDYRTSTTVYEGSSFALDIRNLRRELRTLLPASRALDAQDVAELLDPGNEHSIARVFRQRLALWAARQVMASVLLTDAELDALLELVDDEAGKWPHRAALTAKLDVGPLAGPTMETKPPAREGIEPTPSAHLERRLRERLSSTPRVHEADVYTPGADPVFPAADGQPRYQRTANP